MKGYLDAVLESTLGCNNMPKSPLCFKLYHSSQNGGIRAPKTLIQSLGTSQILTLGAASLLGGPKKGLNDAVPMLTYFGCPKQLFGRPKIAPASTT